MCRSTVWKQMLGQLMIGLILTHCIKLLEHSFILMLMAEEVRNSAVVELASTGDFCILWGYVGNPILYICMLCYQEIY